MEFSPDPENSRPVYLQLAEYLAGQIRAGALAAGARLPSERQLAEQLGLSRTTTTSAYQELMSRGLVRAHVGRGTQVVGDANAASNAPLSWNTMTVRQVTAQPTPPQPLGIDPISFGDGWLHESLSPTVEIRSAIEQVSKDAANVSLAAPVNGLPQLRDALTQRLRNQTLLGSSDGLLVTGGAQQGLNLVATTLLSPGDVVLCESPTWHGAFRAFASHGAETVTLSSDEHGIEPDALEDAIQRLRPKLIYLIPSYQCPTGRVMPLARRQAVLDICNRLRTPILESHVYGETGFDIETPPSLKSLDTTGLVIHMGSVSKTLSAALRLGWLVASQELMPMLANAKAALDLGTPTLPQAILANLLENGIYDQHLVNLRRRLRQRSELLATALLEFCPGLRWRTPVGGPYLWARLPNGLDGDVVAIAAAAQGVAVRSGRSFYPDHRPTPAIRLCYAAPAQEDIANGARRLGRALDQLGNAQRQSRDGEAGLAAV